MIDCDIFAAFVDSNGNVRVEDYWANENGTPHKDTNDDGEDNFRDRVVLYNEGIITASFTRDLSTDDDDCDQDIDPDEQTYICWDSENNDNDIDKDASPGISYLESAYFVWATESSEKEFDTINASKKDHGVLLTIAWAVAAPIGILVARYCKAYEWWGIVHLLCMLFTALATIISVSMMVEEDEYPLRNLSDEKLRHSRLGMIITSIIIGQVVFGFCSSYFKVLTKNTQMTILINRMHRFVGFSLFIAGLYNCWIGWYNYSGSKVIIIAYVLICVLFLLFELLQRFYWNRITPPDDKLPEYTHLQAIQMIKEKKVLMFADELVINVEKFILSHPGGSFLVAESIGEDTGKYMVGCSSYGDKHYPYAHSAKAFSLLKTLAIGRIPTPKGYFSSAEAKQPLFMKFQVVKQVKLNEHTSALYLSNPNFRLNSACTSAEWLGKHFMVAYKEDNVIDDRMGYVKRYYSSLFVDILQWETELGIKSSTEETEEGLVKFIYKAYPGGKMTTYLSYRAENDYVLIRGPLGPGLLLSELKGNYLGLGGGTGLVPFLDLVHMAWKTFGPTTGEFSFRLYAFFRSNSDGFALDILRKIAETCAWLKFRLVSNEDPNKQNVGEDLKNEVKENLDLIWICGPSGFNRSYCEMFKGEGVDRMKIILL